MSDVQSASSHAKMVPAYHYVAVPLILVATVYLGSRVINERTMGAVALLALALGTFIGVFFARVFALGVQDRVIRLEERLRMERLLPDDLRARIHEISTDQLIALRFASDEELADLTRRVLAGELADRKAIKHAVKDWRADHQRI
ncbi:MAG: DUF6526 family protein [Longimicrobiales bacterium]